MDADRRRPPQASERPPRRQNGAAIRAIRRKDGRGVSELAEACKLAPGALTNIECNHRQASWEALNRIARELAVPVKALLRDPDGPQPVAADEPNGTAA